MSEDIRALSEKLVGLASHAKLTLSFAESCTGGMAAAAVTDISGASSMFLGSAVTYSNEAKMSVLGVSGDVLERYGAVSSECAEQMAVGSRRIYGSDIAMSVTGIAGPDGGSAEKPVGTVWFGFSDKDGAATFMRAFKGGRKEIREASVKQILFFVIERLS
ncbi:MAG: CinA family protein [Synergistaceae bacterium]|nr:CinA family protein [Synergistaceae bacterium]